MNKQEAIDAMKAGKILTHEYFQPNEWVTIRNGAFVFEDGISCTTEMFWNDRKHAGWDDGWREWKPIAELVIFAVYKNPSDYPGKWVVIKFTGLVPDDVPLTVADSMDEARKAIPPGMVNIGRHHNDDPVIFETWL
jgi:hypothetical protein